MHTASHHQSTHQPSPTQRSTRTPHFPLVGVRMALRPAFWVLPLHRRSHGIWNLLAIGCPPLSKPNGQSTSAVWGLGWVGLAASCRSRPSGVGFLPCPTTRLNYLTVRSKTEWTVDSHQTPPKRRWAEDTVILCVGARAGVGARARRRSWAGQRGWALRVGGKCGLVLQAQWGGHGSLTRSPTGSSGPGHRILLVTETRCPPVPRLRTHGDGCASGTTGGTRAP